MRIEPTRIEGVKLVRLDSHADERGSFARTYCEETFAEAGIDFRPVQANQSRNTAKHTLRGLHYQNAPHGEAKLVACPEGRIWDVALDMREGSSSYRRWQAFELSRQNATSLYLPEGIAHGFLTLEPDTTVDYLMGSPYMPGAATGIRWDDPAIGIDWPAQPEAMSERDSGYALLEADS